MLVYTYACSGPIKCYPYILCCYVVYCPTSICAVWHCNVIACYQVNIICFAYFHSLVVLLNGISLLYFTSLPLCTSKSGQKEIDDERGRQDRQTNKQKLVLNFLGKKVSLYAEKSQIVKKGKHRFN